MIQYACSVPMHTRFVSQYIHVLCPNTYTCCVPIRTRVLCQYVHVYCANTYTCCLLMHYTAICCVCVSLNTNNIEEKKFVLIATHVIVKQIDLPFCLANFKHRDDNDTCVQKTTTQVREATKTHTT